MKNNANLDLIKKEESLLLIIDLQDKFVPFLKSHKRVLQSTKLLISVAKQLQMPIIVTEHNPSRIGPTLDELKAVMPDMKYYAKNIFSCFGDEEIKKTILNMKNIKNILIVGCETHICVLQTTIDALNLGYNVHIASDGVSSRKDIDWEFGLKRALRAGAVIATSEMMSYELLKRSDTADFKALLPAFKEWVNKVEE